MSMVIAQQANKVWSGPALARLNQQTGALLKQIQDNPGVSGALICDNHGSLLAARFSNSLERSALEQAGQWVAQILAALELRWGRIKEAELAYDNAGLLVRDLGNAFEIVRCAPGVNWALLRMALNVLAAPFEKDAELQKSLSRIAQNRADTLAAETDPEAQRWIRHMKMDAVPETATAAPASISNAIELMVRFTNLLIEEFGDHGFGRDNAIRVVEHRLSILIAKQPLLGLVRVANRRVDIPLHEVAPADFDRLAAGWGELVKELRLAAVDNLGAKMADTKYRKVYETVLDRDVAVQSSSLERVLPKV
jgi:hypothetical protein